MKPRILGMTPGERIALSYAAAEVVGLPRRLDTRDARAMLGGWWTELWTTTRVGRC